MFSTLGVFSREERFISDSPQAGIFRCVDRRGRRLHVNTIKLSNFRNYPFQEVPLFSKLNILIGSNAQGKTSILEALYCLSTTRSFRAINDEEMISFGAESSFVEGVFEHDGSLDLIRLEMTRGKGKILFINGKKQERLSVIFGRCPTVVFSPDDTFLIKGGSFLRRRFLNTALAQTDAAYLSDLQSYERALKQRNALLKSSGIASERELTVWEESLAQYGSNLMMRRRGAVTKLAGYAGKALWDLTDGGEQLEVTYSPSVSAEGDTKAIAVSLLDALKRARGEELVRGSTMYGPHRDDLVLTVNGRSLKKYGSQGQQRTAALALKLAELALLTEDNKPSPLILFDDVMSELDHQRQLFFLERLRSNNQVLLTGTSEDEFITALQDARLFTITNGIITVKSETSSIHGKQQNA